MSSPFEEIEPGIQESVLDISPPTLSPTPRPQRVVSFETIPERPQSVRSFSTANLSSQKKKDSRNKKTQKNKPDGEFLLHARSRPESPNIRFYGFKREISTPEWSPGIDLDSSPPQPKRPKEFDIIKAHTVLEVYEERIQSGTDSRFHHPAQARLAAGIDPDPILTDYEQIFTQNYTEQSDRIKVPTFWVPRCWDTPDWKLSQEQSETLRAEIDKITVIQPVSTSSSSYSNARRQKKGNRTRQTRASPTVTRILLTQVQLPVGSFATDDEDLTDLDDF